MTRLLLACYSRVLRLYPTEFRERYAREMDVFIRDFALEHDNLTLARLLATDLFVSLPREHMREGGMRIAAAVVLILMVIAQIVYDLMNPDLRMGFTLVLALTTALAAALQLLAGGRRTLWSIPAMYAAAAASWVTVTPIAVSGDSALRSLLFELGQPAALAFLFGPIVIALVPAFARSPLAANIATALMATYVLAATLAIGAFYVPAGIAMVGVRVATHLAQRRARV